jgi:AhpD family alkylhydroperoxidase
MPLTQPVSESDATGKVKEIFDEIRQRRQLAEVPLFWRTIAVNPEYLEATWNKLKVVMAPSRIDRKTKEMIAVAISATNNCDYCLRSHTDALRDLGVDDATLIELMGVVDFFNGSNAIASGLRVEYEPPVYAEVGRGEA